MSLVNVRYLSFVLVSLCVVPSVVYAQPPIIDPDITTDMLTGATPEQRQQKAWDELQAQNAELETTNPKAALQAYTEFYKSHDKMAAPVAVNIALHMGDLYAKNLKDNEMAARIYDSAFERYHEAPPTVELLSRQAQLLLQAKKPQEAETFLIGHRDDIARTWTHIAVPALEAWSLSLAAQNKSDEQIALLEQALLEHPQLLNGTVAYYDSIFYNPLTETLSKAGRQDQALGWAKLRFMAVPYDVDAIDRASRMVVKVWTQIEPDKKGVTAFAAAQKDASKANPLQEVALPAVDNAALQARLTTFAAGSEGASDRVIFLIASNRLDDAMREAQALLKNPNTAEKGALEVARVFKAADLNLLSANAFLKYLQKPTGDDPIATFLQNQAKAGARQ